MSDTTNGPDETDAVPADEGDTTQPSTTDAAAEVRTDAATPSAENDLANALTAEPAPEPAATPEPEPAAEPEPVAEASAADVAAPVALDAPEPDSSVDSVDAEQADRARLDEAVQRANAGAVASDEPAVTASEPTVPVEPVHGGHETPIDYEAYAEPVSADSVRRETYVPPAPAAVAAAGGAATLAPEPVVQRPQTIYVQAPVPPKSKGNRGFGALVAAVGAIAFALLYAGVSYLILIGRGDSDRAADVFVSFLGSAVFWVPIVAVLVGFALLAAIINRGPWWTYAVFGLLVGVFVYFAYIGASLLTVQAWTLTYDEAVRFIGERWLDPFAIAAAVIAREIPIWFGGWIAARGRTVTERNRLDREAYDRELAAGPKPAG